MSQIPPVDHFSNQLPMTRNIVFVAFPDVQMLDVCGPFDAFSFANRGMAMTGNRPTYQLEVVAAQAGPLMTCSGLQIVAHHAYPEFDHPIDTLIVAGGLAALERARSDAALVAWIRETAPRALSERVTRSSRNFARLFMQETGMTPAEFVEGARLEAARCTLEKTVLPVEAIAERCGFGDPERMRRSFRRVLRVSPQDYRARFKSTVLH